MRHQSTDQVVSQRQERAEKAFARQEDGAQARSEYEANAQGVRERTARLRAQRLEKEAKERKLSERTKREGAAVAAEMANRQLDRLGDPTANQEQRARRKRSLVKGPKEFRNLRNDLSEK